VTSTTPGSEAADRRDLAVDRLEAAGPSLEGRSNRTPPSAARSSSSPSTAQASKTPCGSTATDFQEPHKLDYGSAIKLHP
jgi:hypothetical protein